MASTLGLQIPSLGSVLGLPPIPPLDLGGAGGSAGPALSDLSSPISLQFGSFSVGGTGNMFSTPQTAGLTSTPSETASATGNGVPNYFAPAGASRSGSLPTSQLLLYGGIACIAIFLLVKHSA